MLEHDHAISKQVGDVIHGRNRTKLEEQPSHVSVEEALRDIIRIIVMVNELVVATMIGTPLQSRTFKCRRTKDENAELYRPLGLERHVGKKAVVSQRDAHG